MLKFKSKRGLLLSRWVCETVNNGLFLKATHCSRKNYSPEKIFFPKHNVEELYQVPMFYADVQNYPQNILATPLSPEQCKEVGAWAL